MSGGVDSAVTAAILKSKGYDVIGVTMAIWGDKKAKNIDMKHNACLGPNEKEDIEVAKQISKKLNIEHIVIDCSKEYDDIVLNNFKSEYLSGNTPNPCVRCNALIKFGVLLKIAKEQGIKFDKFATGHYANIVEKDGVYYLKKARDKKKDQSYFLYKLIQEQLKNIILPLGNMTKDEVRKIASEYGLPVADKKDSQDFYEGDYNELLSIDNKEGNIIDEREKILGKHNGFWNYTIGQRKGLNISFNKPLYVIKLNKDTNEVVVGDIDATFKKELIATEVNFPSVKMIDEQISYKAKIRSSNSLSDCKINLIEEKLKVEFLDYQKAITKGQSVVVYNDETVVCGGIISEVF